MTNNTQVPVEEFTKKAEERAAERRLAWDRYLDAVCQGAPEEEKSRLYWRAAGLTEVVS